MKNKFPVNLLFLLIAFFFSCLVGNAQTEYHFDHLTVNNGLSSNRIWCIHRDQKDFLWISTDVGLDKYNSYEVKKYRFDEKQAGTISSDNVISIYEDRNKNLWFGTSDGLNLYDPVKDNFKVFKNNPADKNSLNGNRISSIIEDKNGTLWVVSDASCLNKWVPETQNFIRYPYTNIKTGFYPRPSPMIATDSKGNFWIVSLGRGIFLFKPESGEFTQYDDPSMDFGSDCHKGLYIDNQDKIWISTDGSGFFSFDPGTGKFGQFGTKGDGKGTNKANVLNIIPEDDNYLLLAVDQGGINRFNKITKTFEYITYDKTNDEGLNNDGIWCFHHDREGILWVGTSGGGVNYYNPKKNKFKLFKHNDSPKSLSYSFTGCFFEDHEGKIWIGTDGGGVNVYDPKTGNFTVYINNPGDPFSISGNVIRCITEDKEHDIWIGTWGNGLNRFERKTGKFYRYMPDINDQSSISGRTIWNFIIDHNDNLWLSGYNVGVDLFNKKNGVIRKFTADTTDTKSISSNQSYLFYEDFEKNMWICTQNGLNLYNSKSNSFKKFNFPDKEIRSFWKDKDGYLWVGSTTKGIFYCNPDGSIIKTYDITNGLPSNVIQAIVEDNQGILWISTSNGVCRFNPKSQEFRNYSKEDGLQGDQFFQQAFLKTRAGDIIFGGFNGFNLFNPDSLKDNDFVPLVYITDFQIFNKPVKYTFTGQFQTHITEAKEITLNSNQSVFSFSFAAINYTNSAKNQYAYIMEGFEKEWNYTNSSRRYVTYTNLDPGTYILRIKASNNDGVWNEKGVTLTINILPPWWKKLWFKAVTILVFILALFLAYYLKLTNYRKKQKELSDLVNKRTEEITNANKKLLDRQSLIENQSHELITQSQNLKIANKHLQQNQNLIKIQADKLQDANNELTKLNATKDRIFSIIAHDLRNPFNVVSGFSELLLEDYRELTNEQIESYLNLIYSTSKNGNLLLENLLQWSRTQTGRISFKPVHLNLFLLAEETSNFLMGDAIRKDIKILLHIDPEIYVDADENMLKTILRNLLSNAIKFTPENGVVTVSSAKKSHYLEVSVNDSGVGIPKEKIPLLFRIETNSSTKGTAQETGTGLGLILCKEFVEKHQGTIRVESEIQKGSRFIFTLPLNQIHGFTGNQFPVDN
ncbi:MAG: two-component regulator propeller domain-containing protein [Prolixibacteraceae bacterium]